MIRLDTTTRKLQIVLGAAKTTNDMPVTVCYNDRAATTYGPGATSVTTSNGTGVIDILAAPGASTTREVDYLSVQNADTVSQKTTIRYNDNGTLYALVVVELNVNETLQYLHGEGWSVLDAQGRRKTVGALYQNGFTLGTTSETDFVAAPAANVNRRVRRLTIYNNDTVAATIMIFRYFSSTAYRMLQITLQSGEAWALAAPEEIVCSGTGQKLTAKLSAGKTTNNLEFTSEAFDE